MESRDELLAFLAGGHADETEVGRLAQSLRDSLGWDTWLDKDVHHLWIGAHRSLTPVPLELALPEGLDIQIGWFLSPVSIERSAPRSLWVLGVSRDANSSLPSLTAVNSELEHVAQSWKDPSSLRRAVPANRGDLTDALSQRYSLVHLATHGRASSTRFEASGLWLSGDSGQPDFVSAHRLRSLHIGADLVVLAACETGQGAGQVGVGVGGVASAMVEAGAGSVVGSRWAIGDRAAAAFSQSFHAALAANTRYPERALREAVREVRAQRSFRNPTHWAGWFALFKGVPRSDTDIH
jgi:CHAT domain-containing protein